MNFEQARSYLLGTVNESVSRRVPYRLERMRAFLRALGDPQNAYPTVHVGGTSGKGSTATLIAAALTAAGKRTGLHTKPHLSSLTERARIDGLPVANDRFAELLTSMQPAIDRTTAEFSRPSYYETLLALTFLYFAREAVDIGVIEVGLGGKLDGTNVITPLVSVITNVGLDHTDVLGDTLEEIAGDKAGIAKPGVPLVCGVDLEGPQNVIRAQCESVGAPFVTVSDRLLSVSEPSEGRFGQSFSISTARGTYQLDLPLLGKFQVRNAAVAIVAMEALPPAFSPDIEDVRRGFESVTLPGRMEVFATHPVVVFDIAHNPDKARSLSESLAAHFGTDRRYTFVVAIGESKDQLEVLRALAAPVSASFICTTFEAAGRPSAKPQRLASLAAELGLFGRAISSPVEALSVARRNADAGDVVVVTGSTFIVATLRDWWLQNVSTEPTAR
ncbi:MAG: bifunctional folylpolyglutamate synthase/dihydrofolate synthase [Candidatus Eremiobacteraeota bacterium]|nr:bifunctional folylpolyglutamate synthase/dihydrofolate synthase [Candidatus Eremiobacteraeota bacterium]